MIKSQSCVIKSELCDIKSELCYKVRIAW